MRKRFVKPLQLIRGLIPFYLLCGLSFFMIVNCSSADDVAKSAHDAAPPAIDFSRHVRPILSNYCFQCHGPDEKQRQGGLRLDLRASALKPAESGKTAITPGTPQSSELLARMKSTAHDIHMPPYSSPKQPTAQEVAVLERWIHEGAEYKLHWSYIKPTPPALPDIKNREWPRTGIDHFILAKLDQIGLAPMPQADRTTLIRRLSLDLTGLPPTPAEVAEFLADDRPSAYENLVDGLLASPHFGERVTQEWLDVGRYGDTNGYENDSDRSMWKYRDWVINAFNRNMPFDEFTIQQIAGDLLPDATPETRTATGFHRNVTYNEEGGADPDEFLVKYAVDRTSTTATVFLGITMGCAECHDHKYDPFSQRDFYSLLAFFNSVDGERGAQGHDISLPPLLSFPTPEQTSTIDATRKRIAELDGRLKVELEKYHPEDLPADAEPGYRELVWIDDGLPLGATAQGTEKEKPWQWVEQAAGPVHSLKRSHVRAAAGLTQHFFTGAKFGLRVGVHDRLYSYVYLDPQNPPKMVMLQFHDGSWEHRAYWGENLATWGTDGEASRRSMGPLPAAGQWVRLEVDAQAVGLTSGAMITGISFTQFDGKANWDKTGFSTHILQAPLPSECQSVWEEYELGSPQPPTGLPKPIAEILQVASAQRTEAQRYDLRNHFLRFVYAESRDALTSINAELESQKSLETKTNNAVVTTMVMTEMPARKPAHVLIRGNYQAPGEEVTPNVPAVLPPLPAGQPANRLGLAYWLVDQDNPLTARVTVNRFWKQFFGTGLVRTVEDFGSQGEFPSHPELLDWLAVEFMNPTSDDAQTSARWNVKALVKTIVCSSTYRQSSRVDSSHLERDPFNRLLGRGARFRLPAEMVRDNALAISGLLNRDVGGKSVYPYQPADYYADKGRWKWPQSQGVDLFRRGVYTFWRRTTFYPSFQIFDAPTREFCTVDRPRTNTPLQALVTLNDPVYVEAARVLGQRMMQVIEGDAATRITYGFQLCVSRQPDSRELDVLQRIHATQLARYQADPGAAEKLVKNGSSPRPEQLSVEELAAWTNVANVLLNLDETIMRE